MDQPDQTLPVHATCVAHLGRGLLILGPSGTGKSSLAIQLIALGASLIADDRVLLHRNGDSLIASCPPQLANRIEARGIGILNVPSDGPVPVKAALSLDHLETDRIPPARQMSILDVMLPLLHKVDMPSFPAALLQYLHFGTRNEVPS